MPKKQRNSEKHSNLLLKLGGGGNRHTCNMEGGERAGACPWWGGRGGLAPLEIGKKMLSEEILTFFTYVLLMKLGGIDKPCIHARNERGWADRRLSMVGGGGGQGGLTPPPLENEKKRLSEDILTSFTYVY